MAPIVSSILPISSARSLRRFIQFKPFLLPMGHVQTMSAKAFCLLAPFWFLAPNKEDTLLQKQLRYLDQGQLWASIAKAAILKVHDSATLPGSLLHFGAPQHLETV
ncbi:hypothetical protein [Stappia sp. BW2]|uniref:hypothetical protein n=1 Tax=Stappia sp. BW2 TaxID=2592622 RepID=UPI0012942DF1|nr:hypothetical protein [Stappia sp. BW2]